VTARCLVVSNCQTVGLGNCLSLLCPEWHIDACHMSLFQPHTDEWRQKLAAYEILIVMPNAQTLELRDFSSRLRVTYAPVLKFRGFHPDLTYLFGNDRLVAGPMNHYHSALVVAAFKRGLSASRARELLSSAIYDPGLLASIWELEKQALLAAFRDHDLDLSRNFVQWMRGDPFMHSINHPRIDALYDLAVQLATKVGVDPLAESAVRPHDNLLTGPVWPIYPSIAGELGLSKGSYFFKPQDGYRLINIDDFVAGSYACYAAYSPDDLRPGHYPYYAQVEAKIEELF
jgi:hypothetical protein